MHNIHNNSPMDLGTFHRIDINLYPLFIAIFEQKNISKAAQLLCISQSATSHALQRLRLQLQDDLFIRTGHQMLPTPFAEQIYPTIKTALLSIQHIARQKQQFEPAMVHTLKIAIHDEIEPIIFPKLVQHFQQLNLEIQFLSSKLDRKTMINDLATQQIDFVIDLEHNLGDKIQFQALVQDRFVVCSQRSSIDKELYLSAPHIGVSSRRSGLLLEDIYLKRNQLSRTLLLRCQHYSTALQILAQHDTAILTIPASILRHLHIDPKLHIFESPVDLPQIDLGMFWYKEMQENARHAFLRAEISKIFA